MAGPGVHTADLNLVPMLDEILGNFAGDSGRMKLDDLVALVVGQASISITGATPYSSTGAGVAGTAEGGYFSVQPGASAPQTAFIIYQKVSGVAVERARVPSSAVTTAIQSELQTVAAQLSSAAAAASEALGKVNAVAAQAIARPGDAPSLFTTELTGAAAANAPLGVGAIVDDASMGRSLRITGADVPASPGYRDIARRIDFGIEPGRVYEVNVVLARTTNPADPESDAIEIRWQNLSATKTSVSNARLGDTLAVTVADGVQRLRFRIGTAGSGPELDYVIPSTARYGRPLVRIYGAAQATAVAILDVQDISGAEGISGDLSTVVSQIAGLEEQVATVTPLVPLRPSLDTLVANLLANTGIATIQGAEIDVNGSGMSMQDADGAEFLGWEGDEVRIGNGGIGEAKGSYLRIYDEDWITRVEIAPGSIIIDGEHYALTGSSGPATLVGPIMGGLTHNSIRFKADVEGSVDAAKLEISTSPAFMKKVGVFFDTPARTEVSAAGDEYYQTVDCDVTGLDPRTRYWARWWLNGKVVGDPMTFKTLPAPGSTGAVKIAWLSCILFSGDDEEIRVFEELAARDDIDLVIIAGDEDYSDIGRNDIFAYRAANFRKLRRNKSFQKLAKKVAFGATESDHSYVRDDPHWDYDFSSVGSTFPQITRTARQVLRETFPFYDFVQVGLGETDIDKIILTQRIDFGLCRLHLIDDQSLRRFQVGTPTLLGNGTNPPGQWNQLGWFLDEIAAVDSDGIKLAFPFIETGIINAVYDGYPQRAPAEQTMICDAIRDTMLKAMALWMSADVHCLLFPGDRQIDKATGGGMASPGAVSSPGKRPGPLNGAGPATWNGVNSKHPYGEAFVVLEINEANDGWKLRGYGLNTTTGVFDVLGPYGHDDVVSAVKFSQATIAGAVGSTVQIPLERTWFGPVDGVDVTITSSAGGSPIVQNIGANAWKASFPFTVLASTVTLTITGVARGSIGPQATITINP